MYKIMIFHNDLQTQRAIAQYFELQQTTYLVTQKAEQIPHSMQFLLHTPPDLLFFQANAFDDESYSISDYIERWDLPIMPVAINPHADFSSVVQAMHHYVKDFLINPFSQKELQQIEAHFLERKLCSCAS